LEELDLEWEWEWEELVWEERDLELEERDLELEERDLELEELAWGVVWEELEMEEWVLVEKQFLLLLQPPNNWNRCQLVH
jgi:hypothetical protein